MSRKWRDLMSDRRGSYVVRGLPRDKSQSLKFLPYFTLYSVKCNTYKRLIKEFWLKYFLFEFCDTGVVCPSKQL